MLVNRFDEENKLNRGDVRWDVLFIIYKLMIIIYKKYYLLILNIIK